MESLNALILLCKGYACLFNDSLTQIFLLMCVHACAYMHVHVHGCKSVYVHGDELWTYFYRAGQYGIGRPFYFLFQPSYWKKPDPEVPDMTYNSKPLSPEYKC